MWPCPFPVFPVKERQTNGMKETVGHCRLCGRGVGGGVGIYITYRVGEWVLILLHS